MARVLVVDDNTTILEMVAFKLGRLGLDVHTEEDGEAGLAAVRALQPDVVLLDWMMPKMTGLEVCAAVRAIDGLEGTHLILLTAKTQEADMARGFEAGADDYIIKPFSPREMAARVTAALAQRAPSL